MGKYLMSRQEFVNEKFGDGVKNVIGKVKSKIGGLFTSAIKVAKNILFFAKDGKIIDANSPLSSVEVGSKIQGIYTASNQAGINTVKSYHKDGVYDLIDENNDILVENFKKFSSYMNESSYDSNDYSFIYEDAVSQLNAESGGLIGIPDWTMSEARETILDRIKSIDMGFIKTKPFVFWGAPGIGKTSIAEMVISTWNEDCRKNNTPEKQKSIIVIDCAQTSVDGFTLPVINKAATMDGMKKSNLLIKTQTEELLKNLPEDRSAEVSELLQNIEIKVVDDTPKTWLPVFNPDAAQGDKDILKLMDSIANGRVSAVLDNNDEVVDYDVHTNGGIIVIDEFLRNPDILHLLMSLIKDRVINGYKLGSKWYVVCCSNRPGDDKTVERAFKEQNDALMQRVEHVNLIPTPSEWKAWAKTKDYFKSEGAKIIMDFAMSKDLSGVEYLYNPAKGDGPTRTESGNIANAPTQRSPRNWASVVYALYVRTKTQGVEDILDLPYNIIEKELSILEDNAENGVKDAIKIAIKQHKLNNGVKINDIVTKEDLNIPDTISEVFNEKTIEGYIDAVLNAFRSQYHKEDVKIENFKPIFTNMAKIIEKSKIDVKSTRIKITELVQTIMSDYVFSKTVNKNGNKTEKLTWRLPMLSGIKASEIQKRQDEILDTLSTWISELDNVLDWDTFDGKARDKKKK